MREKAKEERGRLEEAEKLGEKLKEGKFPTLFVHVFELSLVLIDLNVDFINIGGLYEVVDILKVSL